MHAAIKSVTDSKVGDTIVNARAAEPPAPLPGYQEPVPVVYCGLFPVETTQYQLLRESLEKLQLNDAALCFEPETSSAMGFGFRCGFLGLLHMEIVQERLEREYGLDLIVTAPSVVYKQELNDGSVVSVDAPSKMEDPDKRRRVSEPYVDMEIFCPKDYSGALMELCQARRGEYGDMKFLTEKRVSLKYSMPLAEVITDFFDQLKSRSKGYASMEYHVTGYRDNDLVRLDILINGDVAPPLANIVHRDVAHRVGKGLTRKLKELIPRQQFKVPIQAAIGAKIVASSTISPMRKDVLAKCYGGDISRKKKLLNKQAKGKKRMKAIGKVNVPQEAFMAVLNLND
jgi:GTP-binding protein LepA